MSFRYFFCVFIVFLSIAKNITAQQNFTSGFFNYEVVTNLKLVTQGTILESMDDGLRYGYVHCVFDNSYTFKKRVNFKPSNSKSLFSLTQPFSIINQDSNLIYSQKLLYCNNESIFFKSGLQNLPIQYTGRKDTILFYACEEVIVAMNNQFDTAYITKELPINISPFIIYNIKEGAIVKYKQNGIEYTLWSVALQVKADEIIKNGLKILAEKTVINASSSNYEPSFEIVKLKKDEQLKRKNEHANWDVFLFPITPEKGGVVDDETKPPLDFIDAINIAQEIESKYKNVEVKIFVSEDAAILKKCNAKVDYSKFKNTTIISNASKWMQAFGINFSPTICVINQAGKVIVLEHFFFNNEDVKNKLMDALEE